MSTKKRKRGWARRPTLPQAINVYNALERAIFHGSEIITKSIGKRALTKHFGVNGENLFAHAVGDAIPLIAMQNAMDDTGVRWWRKPPRIKVHSEEWDILEEVVDDVYCTINNGVRYSKKKIPYSHEPYPIGLLVEDQVDDDRTKPPK